MFKKSIQDRLSSWFELRKQVDENENSLNLIAEFWSQPPFTPYNKNINQYDKSSWPSPWQILVDNVYDDFTVALMIAYSVKYTNKYKDSSVKIDTLINNSKNQIYNIVVIDDFHVLNYRTSSMVTVSDIDKDLYLDSSLVITRQ